jgi:general secretion pathway protein M
MKWNVDIKLPNSRAAGAAAIVIGFVAVSAIGLYLVKGMVDAQTLELDAKTTQIAALQRRLKMPALPAAGDSAQNVFLEGANYALAANSLQQHIVELVEQSGGKIVSVAVETPAATAQTSRRVIVQVRADLDNDGLQSLLYELETGYPLVLVDTLNVNRSAKQGPGDDSKRSPRLTVDLRAVGFYRGART